MSTTISNNLELKQKQYRDFDPSVDCVELRRGKESADIILTINDNYYQIGRVASIFPISSPYKNIAFFDEEGGEIGKMKRSDGLDEHSRRILHKELEKSYFMPHIQKILVLEENRDLDHWEVVTDRGERTFKIRNPRRNVRRLGNRRIFIKDVDGNRYEVPDWEQMDKTSRILLMNHL